KYKVTPYDNYRLNPDAQAGIHENDVILVPVAGKITVAESKPKPSASKPAMHTAVAKETLYSISKMYNVTVDELKVANPFLSEGLKIGQVLKIPGGTAATTVAVSETKPKAVEVTRGATEQSAAKSGSVSFHVVEPKETKFGIAKKYGISVADLERQNPGIGQNLPVGYKLSIGATGSAPARTETVAETRGTAERSEAKPKPVTTEAITPSTDITDINRTVKKTGYANYEVKPKETMFSLTQMLGISEEELIKLNPTLKDGLKIGMILKVPGKGSMVAETSTNKSFEDLSKTISGKDRKQLVLLLPFNATKIQGDTLKTLATRLKKDAFLNMTLDFYSGALVAIDSAKALGLNIDVRIFDSEESKLSSNVANIVQNNKLQEADAVIGPFYQQHAEKVADLLSKNNVPVISPLSKESGKPYANLYQAMPTSDYSKSAVFNYMISKNGNIIVVSDPKKAANREFITQHFPQAKFVELDENGNLNAEKLKAMFVKDIMNYVVIDSERTGMILSTTNVLLNEMANQQLQLVIIEPNETLDFDEISMKRLTILKLLYPSLTRENESPESVVFENEYKKKNKIFPSQYATRGFDITFDTMLRLSQDKGFAASANDDKTEQVESKFDYAKKEDGGYINKGVYILQYNEDLSVKEAN
ncbi:MAG TPA: LysM peptidoglycan-binding domain-containing protein, partial [Flavobacterium sp.]|nr:LysM peptidoglycan-binding domain-containing protein [Flavobacterium sp.]